MRALREAVVGNVWPQKQLEELHCSEGYNGSQLRAITPIHVNMPAFMLAEEESVPLKDFIDMVGIAPIHTWVMEVGDAIAVQYNGMKPNGDIMSRVDQLRYHSMLMAEAGTASSHALAEKAKINQARPEWCKHPEYQDTSDKPCHFSYVMCRVIKKAGEYFESEDKELLYDTAFLIALLPAMAGLNSVEACMYSVVEAGLMSD